MMRKIGLRAATIILAGGVLAACSSDEAVQESGASSTGGSEAYTSGYQYPNDGVSSQNLDNQSGQTDMGGPTQQGLIATAGDRVFFALDSHALNSAAQSVLRKQAQWMAAYPNVNVVIEGHADERGTREYNLALGDRRANSVREFLITLGVAPRRISTVSYGKERPEAACSAESCWSVNRRGVTSVQ